MIVVLPVYKEQARIAEGVAYFSRLAQGVGGHVVVVSTQRELGSPTESKESTVELAADLATSGTVRHVHCSDPAGRKGDQINFAVATIAKDLPPETHKRTLVVVYDIDSRPPAESLGEFSGAAANHPTVNVFHQSSRFEMRDRPAGTLARVIGDSGALRANRFVLSSEMPRLLGRHPQATPWRGTLARVTYGHVTGHGLGARLSFLLLNPLPTHSSMEDMAWSFDLAARHEPVVPLATLDCADVPGSVGAQFRQQAQWFLGPARALRYRRATPTPGAAADVVTASALAGVADWLSAAFTIPILLGAFRARDRHLRWALRALTVGVLMELISAEVQLGAKDPLKDRIGRVLAYPASNTMFGVAGWSALPTVARGEESDQR